MDALPSVTCKFMVCMCVGADVCGMCVREGGVGGPKVRHKEFALIAFYLIHLGRIPQLNSELTDMAS